MVEGEELPGAGATHVDNRQFTINDAENVQAGDHNTQEIGTNYLTSCFRFRRATPLKKRRGKPRAC